MKATRPRNTCRHPPACLLVVALILYIIQSLIVYKELTASKFRCTSVTRQLPVCSLRLVSGAQSQHFHQPLYSLLEGLPSTLGWLPDRQHRLQVGLTLHRWERVRLPTPANEYVCCMVTGGGALLRRRDKDLNSIHLWSSIHIGNWCSRWPS